MNNQTIPTRKRKFASDLEGIERPGDFCFDDEREHLFVMLPGQIAIDAIPIQRGPQGGPRVWGWDGNEENPTLTPSILSPGAWHGFLRNGILESC